MFTGVLLMIPKQISGSPPRCAIRGADFQHNKIRDDAQHLRRAVAGIAKERLDDARDGDDAHGPDGRSLA